LIISLWCLFFDPIKKSNRITPICLKEECIAEGSKWVRLLNLSIKDFECLCSTLNIPSSHPLNPLYTETWDCTHHFTPVSYVSSRVKASLSTLENPALLNCTAREEIESTTNFDTVTLVEVKYPSAWQWPDRGGSPEWVTACLCSCWHDHYASSSDIVFWLHEANCTQDCKVTFQL
jgi:hypothetical protein